MVYSRHAITAMSSLEIILYILLFAGIAVGVAVPLLRWYKYNVSLVYKKKMSLYGVGLLLLVIIALVIYSLLS